MGVKQLGHTEQSGLVLCFPVLFLGKGAWVSTCSVPCAMRDRQESLEPASIWLMYEANGEKMTWGIIWVRNRISRTLFLLTIHLLLCHHPQPCSSRHLSCWLQCIEQINPRALTLLLGTTLDNFIWFLLCNLVSELHTIIYSTVATLCCSCLQRFSTWYIMVTAFP